MSRTAIPADEVFRKARAVGQYYGFASFASLAAEMRGTLEKSKGAPKNASETAVGDAAAAVMGAFLTQCKNAGFFPGEGQPPRGPLFVWHTNITPGRAAPKRALVQFHAIGTEHALAEAVVIRALSALVADLYHAEPLVRINSMGDRETRARYVRELGVFFKRRASLFPEECIAAATTDAFAAAELAIARECADMLPLSTEYLSDASRKRFEDLLEHLEETGTPYELARDLMSNGTHWNDACFEIVLPGQETSGPGKRVVWGSRYHELARGVMGAPLAAVGALLYVDSAPQPEPIPQAPSQKTRFVFIHIGDEAKRLSLTLAEDFRRAHVPLTQDIGVESLIEQMRYAEKRNPPYLLVMGRKEALEGTVILRDRQTQEETILPLHNLAERLKAVV